MRGVIRVEVRSWTVMARGGSGVCRRCAGNPSGGPEYDPGPVSQHGCDNSVEVWTRSRERCRCSVGCGTDPEHITRGRKTILMDWSSDVRCDPHEDLRLDCDDLRRVWSMPGMCWRFVWKSGVWPRSDVVAQM
jgi:hypothetical protein